MTNHKKEDFKKSYINYIDIVLAVTNSLIIIFPLIIFHENVELSVIGVFLSGGLLTLAIYTFIRNNPMYIYYSDILLVGGILFFFPFSAMINLELISTLSILFFIEVGYLCYRIKVHIQYSELNRYAKIRSLASFDGRYYLNVKKVSQQWDNSKSELEVKKLQYKEKFENQYHYKKIFTSSLILCVSLLVVFTLLAINMAY